MTTPTITRHRHDPRVITFTIGARSWYFSYNNLVGYRGPEAPEGLRLRDAPSDTSERHMHEMGIGEWVEVEADELSQWASALDRAPL